MVEAAESRPGSDPDRCGFTMALRAARDLVVQATNITGSAAIGVIGRRILAGLLPARRPRISTRKVKSPISRYHGRQIDGRPDTSRTVTGLNISILEPGPQLRPPHTTTVTPRRNTAAGNVSWRSSTPSPSAIGTHATSPATSAHRRPSRPSAMPPLPIAPPAHAAPVDVHVRPRSTSGHGIA